MNNSIFALEGLSLSEEESRGEERNEMLRMREENLTKVIKALEEVEQSESWSSLKTLIFDSLKENLQKKIFQEATKEKPDVSILNSLKGEWTWAKRYADLSVFRDEKRLELAGIRKSLHGKKE